MRAELGSDDNIDFKAKLRDDISLGTELSSVERVWGIEPHSPTWKAGVIATIRYPQAYEIVGIS